MKNNNERFSFLKDFTKEEIITWILRGVWWNRSAPLKSELLYIRWDIRSKKLEEKQKKRSLELKQILDPVRRKDLTELFNNEPNPKKRIKIADKLLKLDSEYLAWRKEEVKCDKENEEINKIYDSIDKARQQE